MWDDILDMLEEIKDGLVLVLRALTKAVVGFIVVPLGIAIDMIKPEWETASRPVKFFTGILLLPATAFLYFAAPWWEDFDILT